MSKKLKDMHWQPVALEGFPITNADTFQGFVGLEECTDYGLEKYIKKSKKKKGAKDSQGSVKPQENINKKTKRKSPSEFQNIEVPSKKVRLSNGFIVESLTEFAAPSQTNLVKTEHKKKKKDKSQLQNELVIKSTNNVVKKLNKPKLGEIINQDDTKLTSEDMLTWAEFKLQEPIMKALTEMGFKNPTKIQQLTLPAAIHGRRDILGAAETGSGKTLAFGLPILSGILKLKEKAAGNDLDVYDIPFKKPAKKTVDEENLKSENKKGKNSREKGKFHKHQPTNEKKNEDLKSKESSEDGYSSGDESSDSESKKIPSITKKQVKKPLKKKKDESDDDFIEEIEVPITKRDNSADEGNDSDEDNYIHLSEMLDSDDLADSSSDMEDGDLGDNDETGDADEMEDDSEENSETEGDLEDLEKEQSDEDVFLEDDNEEDVVLGSDDDDHNGDSATNGIGCVKVIDNIEIPGHVSVKTGKPLYALILTPTRELAIQISRHLIAAAKYTGIKIATIVGGMAAVKQERVLRSGPEVVVATPGRLWELVSQGQPHLQQLDTVKFLAIDETDRMIERGHFEELHPLLERLNTDEARKRSRQNFVFSATLTLVHDLPSHMKGKKVTKHGKIINRKIAKMTPQQKIKRLVDMIGMTDPKVVDITANNSGTAETLTECRITCPLDQKDAYLYYIIKRHPGRSIVFCNSIGSVRRLATILTILKCNPLPLHASMPQRQRLKNLERFRDDPHGVLIATDVAARGLDIPDVDHVIQYQVPRTAENYVHRSGRTARANKEGINVLMVEPNEAYLYSKLCLTLNKTTEVPTFPVAPHILSPLKDLVVLARELDALELKKKRAAQAHGWREKAARDLDMIIDDDDIPVQTIDPAIDKALKVKRRKLDAMLSRPVFPKGFSFKYPSLNDPNVLQNSDDNALQVMKKALESGEIKKEKRKSKNAPLLKLEKQVGSKKYNKKFKTKKNKKQEK